VPTTFLENGNQSSIGCAIVVFRMRERASPCEEATSSYQLRPQFGDVKRPYAAITKAWGPNRMRTVVSHFLFCAWDARVRGSMARTTQVNKNVRIAQTGCWKPIAEWRNAPCHLGRPLPKTGPVGDVHADQERAQYLPPATSGKNMRRHRVEGSRRGCETRTATSITILRKDVVWMSVFPYAKCKCKNYKLQTETCRSCAISSPAAPGSLAVTSLTI